jgi:hypothetical protein
MIEPTRKAAMRPEQVAVVDSSAVGGEEIENLVSGPGSLERFRVPVPWLIRRRMSASSPVMLLCAKRRTSRLVSSANHSLHEIHP